MSSYSNDERGGNSRGGGGGGRGNYYKNKYGGGGRGRRGGGRGNSNGRSGGRGRGGGGGGRSFESIGGSHGGGSYEDLISQLRSIDNNSYPAYKSIESSQKGWGGEQHGFTLYIGKAQSDPYAPPTRCRVVVPAKTASFPPFLYANNSGCAASTAIADYVHRQFYQQCLNLGADQAANSNQGAGGGWSGPKGGDISIDAPSQHVLEQQTAVQFNPATGNITAQFTINLPARGRTILGFKAIDIVQNTIPTLVQKSLIYNALDQNKLRHHVLSIQDQHWLRTQLQSQNLVAFVPNGALLPRASGSDDRPMERNNSGDINNNVVLFESPENLQVSFDLPNSKRSVVGMGIRKGINLIVGGGFHGKSTLLSAIQFGIYNKIPGDGREFCVCDDTAVKIRAEDGRGVTAVDISPFITNLPFGKTTTNFTSADASGSTSQASNIIESIEMGSKLLLLDEDTCATNFMIRDSKMMELVANEHEPITPFISKVEALYNELGVSTILVIGGTGDYFDVATTVIMMNCYKCFDVTEKAKAIANKNNGTKNPSTISTLSFGSFSNRCPQPEVFQETGKVSVRSQSLVSYGDTELDLRYLEQIVTKSQLSSISFALRKIPSLTSANKKKTIKEIVGTLITQIKQDGLDMLSPGTFNGGLAYARPFEIAAAINRLRRRNSITQRR